MNLKPCPFCGGTEFEYKDGGSHLACANKKCCMWGWLMDCSDWNVRATEPELKLYTDQCFEGMDKLVKDLDREHLRQLNKWGVQTHSMFEWMNYLTEEVGELAEAVSNSEYVGTLMARADAYAEAIQVATLALKIAEMYND